MERKHLQQLLASAQQELNRLSTKEKALTRKEKTHKKIVLGGEVAKYMGLDIDHDMLVGFLLTFASSTEIQRKAWLSNGARARQHDNMRKEQKNKSFIKKDDQKKSETGVNNETNNIAQPDGDVNDKAKSRPSFHSETFSAMLEKKTDREK